MSLVTETGTADPNAESYISVASADTYFSSIGNLVWAAMALSDKEQCLRKAANYMIQHYRLKWQGLRVTSFQALDWPRWNVTLADLAYYNNILPTVIPVAIQRANAELAVLAFAGDLNPPLTQQTTRKTVGPITVEYDVSSSQAVRYGAIHDMLAPYMTTQAASGNIKMTRC
jgi:hypothetical protein